ncbi:tetratricopeptide repeat protein [Shimia abyssi]|uniref:Tetratricopeptide repeat protein 38 n=1 Tax=Shimia abyssi TaxID=1662395 RepID=A0A2P8FBK1_9RHOB|nr:tetratricopeptide repeat protein [Shimia abyssi]PSL19068.1 hypothetical protein CLV88_10711 [Shimia abyssi]
MYHDICTCEVSLTDSNAVSEWNGVILGVLSHGQAAPVHLGKLLELAPDWAMAHAIKGLMCFMLARREMVPVAIQSQQEAHRCLALGGATTRERLWCAALDEWIAGNPTGAVARVEQALLLNRADTISMKLSHGIRFMVGDSVGMRASVEAVLDAQGSDHELHGYVMGCHAFALEETGAYSEAERAGLIALNYAKDDAWGLHAVAHVYDMTHRTQKGIELIDGNHTAWSHCNNFRFHVWWHKALLHLDQGDVAQVLSLYDTKIRDEKTDDYRDFSNASSLLMRLELEGVDVGHRWTELADLAETRTDDGCLVFADLHYMLALSGDKRHDAAERLTARVAATAWDTGEPGITSQDPGLAAAEGLAAFGEANYSGAFAKLLTAQPRFNTIGGSHAQRDVFQRVLIESGMRAGKLDETETLLKQRNTLRSGEPDAFAQTRMDMIAKVRASQATVAAE